MSDIAGIIQLMRALTQFGITAEQYQQALNNPDMSDEELVEHIGLNSDRIAELRDKDHA
jgi:hypothetical protein